MKTLNRNFDFFDYTPKAVSKAKRREIELKRAENIAKNNERLEKRIKSERYNKSLVLQLG